MRRRSRATLDPNAGVVTTLLRVIEFREMSHLEIILPQTRPETEWLRGKAVQKVSPTRNHGRVQLRIACALDAWARGRGEVATEWRFRLKPGAGPRRPLVPDVAYVGYDRLRGHGEAELQAPDFSPTVVVEISSPGDEPRDVAHKMAIYLACGVQLVVELDPVARTATLHDKRAVRRLTRFETLTHEALEGFSLELGPFFSGALDVVSESP